VRLMSWERLSFGFGFLAINPRCSRRPETDRV
jgi:hypothetical protein